MYTASILIQTETRAHKTHFNSYGLCSVGGKVTTTKRTIIKVRPVVIVDSELHRITFGTQLCMNIILLVFVIITINEFTLLHNYKWRIHTST
jgi:hypothetical protein